MQKLLAIDNGQLQIEPLQLYLDSRKRQPFGYISHAHSDHIANHQKVLASPATYDLICIRLKRPQAQIVSFFETITLGRVRIKLLPAGHILGSSQIYLETENRSFLYTGDFRTKKSRTVESFALQTCDILIMESTFGLPQYRFPDRQEIEEVLIKRLTEKLNIGLVPIVFVYALGKGQEILHLLSHSGLPVAVDHSILKYITIYNKYGVQFGLFDRFRKSSFKNNVLLLPVHMRYHRFIKQLEKKYLIYLSGWGMDANAAARFGVDLVLPYSDHADYDELLAFIERVSPKEIYCTHGFTQFVEILNNKGYRANCLYRKKQLELFS
jgi:Cft2 family RNA processing exonuclease